MRAHASYFKLFLPIPATSRRHPKRRAAAAGSSKSAPTAPPPSSSAIDQAFSSHLARMSKSGVYGDNLEISAFAREYGCNVKIYQRDFAYVVTGDWDGNGDGRKTVHIGYHVSPPLFLKSGVFLFSLFLKKILSIFSRLGNTIPPSETRRVHIRASRMSTPLLNPRRPPTRAL